MYSLTVRNRASAVLLAIVVLSLGAVFLTVGLALLLALAAAGGVIALGVAVYRRLRGYLPASRRQVHGARTSVNPALDPDLDPELEVQPRGVPTRRITH